MIFRKLLFLVLLIYLAFAAWWVVVSGFARLEMLNVACDPTRELWRDINSQFLAQYPHEKGTPPIIRQSHGGSGSQARAVIDGLDADVVTLALWTDTDAIRAAGLIDPGWEDRLPNRSLPFTSTIVFVVRKGNPLGIRDWRDLDRPNVQVITPNPKTSGNGKWSFLAMWGGIITRGGSDQEAEEYLTRIYRRVPVLDASARGSTMTFAQKQIGDVHLTWENEAYLEVEEARGELEMVHPPVSVLAEPHVAVVDAVVRRKHTRAIAEAYLRYLYTEPAQEIIARHYYRPTNEAILAKHSHLFPRIQFFTARELGASWQSINRRFFLEGGLFDQIFARGRNP